MKHKIPSELGIFGFFFTGKVFWARLSREVLEFPFLEIPKPSWTLNNLLKAGVWGR